jgi:hypothetical protein
LNMLSTPPQNTGETFPQNAYFFRYSILVLTLHLILEKLLCGSNLQTLSFLFK